MSKFVIKTTATGFTFHLKAGNGQTIATSEVYSSESACQKGIDSVKVNAPVAALEDQTAADYPEAKHPKFELYADKKGEFRFRLTAKNGQTIAVSEGYTTHSAALNGVESVRKNAPTAEVEKED